MHALLAKLETKLDLLRAETAKVRDDLAALAAQVGELPGRRDIEVLKLRWAIIGLLGGVILATWLIGGGLLLRGG